MSSKRKFFLPPWFLVVLISANQLRCSSKREGVVSDSLSVAVDTAIQQEYVEPSSDGIQEIASNFIRYSGVKESDQTKILNEFPPFAALEKLTRRSVAVQDSLESIHQRYGEPLTDPADTLVLHPFKEKAYQAILDYKKQMAAGAAAKLHCPSLLELDRMPDDGDSSVRFLPAPKLSDFLSRGNFFFLGGAPFISSIYPEDNTAFTDLQGKPEIHFATSLTENAQYLLTSLYCAKPGPIDIDYGPPLHTYEMGPAEVHGIGSLTHRFRERVPVYFVTEKGSVPGHLLSVNINLAEAYECGTGDAYIELACNASLAASDILAIYIPYDATVKSCVVNRPSEHVWTADINGDGIADFACFSDTYVGSQSDTIVEELWFVNVNGTWRIIDWGAEPECT